MILYAATIALSAFLLFLVQPVIARQILPWFGGSAAVWTTCMVFFQVALLFGYAYSDWIIRRLSPTRQALMHSVLLVVSLAFLPIVVPEAMKPADANQPAGRILLMLTATIGLPYLMLATTGPLVQAWFTRRYQSARVYRLYALSNVASMLALIAYPPVIEPNATGHAQSVGWSTGYALFVGLAIAAAWFSRKATLPLTAATSPLTAAAAKPGTAASAPAMASPATTSAVAAGRADVATAAPLAIAEPLMWLVLAALGSVLLLSVTSHITQNVASIPFLWVLPLSIYLLSFILCFDGTGWYRRSAYGVLAALLAVVMLAGLSFRPDGWWVERLVMNIETAVPLYAFGLFVTCMFVHGELVARKPAPAHLTRFYLMVSLGGAIGGLLVGIVAPLASNWYWELPLGLVMIASLVALVTPGWVRAVGLLAAFGCAALLVDYVRYIREDTVALTRNFYGTLRISESTNPDGTPMRRRLLHGVILHGDQYFNGDARREPTTYYGTHSGIGVTIDRLRTAGQPLRIGMIGVGTGTLTAYGRSGDIFRLYELNPTVFEVADRWFSYINDSPATIEKVTGDARLVMEREPDQQFDVLAVDAFSSDSIPVHLLTTEAVAVYKRHLSERGVVLFHISNRYLDLAGVVARLDADSGLTARHFIDEPPEESRSFRTVWIAL
ncbi:MAG: fused MFS/spermidine synthase, partial [Burkholderiaceae bacterium]